MIMPCAVIYFFTRTYTTAGEIAPSTLVHILPLGRFSTESWKNDRAQLSDFYI